MNQTKRTEARHGHSKTGLASSQDRGYIEPRLIIEGPLCTLHGGAIHVYGFPVGNEIEELEILIGGLNVTGWLNDRAMAAFEGAALRALSGGNPNDGEHKKNS